MPTFRRRFAALCAPLLLLAAAARQAWQVGDRVQAYNVDWYDGTVAQLGSGTYAGYYLIKWDRFSGQQWIRAADVRARPDAGAAAAATAHATAAGPRLGRYRILSFGAGGSAIALGEIELLAGGRYRATLPGGRGAGEGRYAYDVASHAIRWLSGPEQEAGYGGAFTVERDGRTHQIRLRGGTVAVNSTDSR